MPEKEDDYRSVVEQAVRDETTFLRLTLSRRGREGDSEWNKISVRPVNIGGQRKMQCVFSAGEKCVTQNLSGDAFQEHLDATLSAFTQIHVQTTAGDLHVRITRKGKVLMTRGRPSRREREPMLAHDREKPYPTALETPDTFLQAIGLMSKEGSEKSLKEGKFWQIYGFLREVLPAVSGGERHPEPLRIVDCGCGRSYLSFALYHYMKHVCGLPVSITGIDRNADRIDRCLQMRDALGWSDLAFSVARIADFSPEAPPDMVVSLHACDTATDEAIAQGILWESRFIFVVPCCQHELYQQLRTPELLAMLRQGVLKERLASLLSDTLRVHVLRIMGYRTDLIEFVSMKETPKNLMIRAEKGLEPGDAEAIERYRQLKEFWDDSPFIERLLGEKMRGWGER